MLSIEGALGPRDQGAVYVHPPNGTQEIIDFGPQSRNEFQVKVAGAEALPDRTGRVHEAFALEYSWLRGGEPMLLRREFYSVAELSLIAVRRENALIATPSVNSQTDYAVADRFGALGPMDAYAEHAMVGLPRGPHTVSRTGSEYSYSWSREGSSARIEGTLREATEVGPDLERRFRSVLHPEMGLPTAVVFWDGQGKVFSKIRTTDFRPGNGQPLLTTGIVDTPGPTIIGEPHAWDRQEPGSFHRIISLSTARKEAGEHPDIQRFISTHPTSRVVAWGWYDKGETFLKDRGSESWLFFFGNDGHEACAEVQVVRPLVGEAVANASSVPCATSYRDLWGPSAELPDEIHTSAARIESYLEQACMDRPRSTWAFLLPADTSLTYYFPFRDSEGIARFGSGSPPLVVVDLTKGLHSLEFANGPANNCPGLDTNGAKTPRP